MISASIRKAWSLVAHNFEHVFGVPDLSKRVSLFRFLALVVTCGVRWITSVARRVAAVSKARAEGAVDFTSTALAHGRETGIKRKQAANQHTYRATTLIHRPLRASHVGESMVKNPQRLRAGRNRNLRFQL